MALSSTIYTVTVDLSDVDRGVYEKLDLKLAMHPSETPEYMVTRVFAYCLEYTEGIELTKGLSNGDEPAIIVRDRTGRVMAWIEVGMPDAERVHRAAKLAERVAIYTHRGRSIVPKRSRCTHSAADSSRTWPRASSGAWRCRSPSPSVIYTQTSAATL
jgi:uncharacterized protein YaeQ